MASSHSVFKDLLTAASQLASRHSTPSPAQMRSSPGVSASSGLMHPASSLSTTELKAHYRNQLPNQHLALAPAAAGGVPNNLTHPSYPYPEHPAGENADEFATALRTTMSSAHQLAAHVHLRQAQGHTDSRKTSQSQLPQQPFPLQQHIHMSYMHHQHHQHQQQHQHQHQQQQQQQQPQPKTQSQQQQQQLPLSLHAVPPPAAFAYSSVHPSSVSTASSSINKTQAAAGHQSFPVCSSTTFCYPSPSSSPPPSSSSSSSSCSTVSVSPCPTSSTPSLKASSLASSNLRPPSDMNMKPQHHGPPSSSSLLIPVDGLHPHQVSNLKPPIPSLLSSTPCSLSGPPRGGILPGIPLKSLLQDHHLDPFSGTRTINSSNNSSSSNSCDGGEEDKFGWRAGRKKKRARRTDLRGFTAEEKQGRRKERARLYSARARERQECEMRALKLRVETLSVYEFIVEESPDMMCVLSADREVKILYANLAFLRLLGLVSESLVGRGLWEMIHTEDSKEVHAAISTTLLSKKIVAKATCRLKSRSMEGEREKGEGMEVTYTKVGLKLRKGTQGLVAIIHPES